MKSFCEFFGEMSDEQLSAFLLTVADDQLDFYTDHTKECAVCAARIRAVFRADEDDEEPDAAEYAVVRDRLVAVLLDDYYRSKK